MIWMFWNNKGCTKSLDEKMAQLAFDFKSNATDTYN